MGLEVGLQGCTAKLGTADDSAMVQMVRKQEEGQDSVHILPFGLPFLFAWASVRHLEVSSAKFLLQGWSRGLFISLCHASKLLGWQSWCDPAWRKRWMT